MICKVCGHRHDLDEQGKIKKFCEACGAPLEAKSEVIPREHQQVRDIPKAVIQKAVIPTFVEQDSESPKNKNVSWYKNKIVISVIGLLSVILIVLFINVLIFQANPVNRLLMGLAKLSSDQKIEAQSTVTFDTDMKTLDNMMLKNKLTFYKKKLEGYSQIQVYYDEEEAVSFNVSETEGIAYISSKELTLKQHGYFEIDQYEDILNDYLIINDIVDNISFSGLKWRKYTKAMEKGLDKDIESKSNTIILDADIDSLEDILEEVLEVVEKDKKLEGWLEKNLRSVTKQLQKNQPDLKWIDLSESELDDYLEFLDEDFHDQYVDFIDNSDDYQDEIKDQLKNIQSIADIEIEFKLSPFNTIKSMVTTIDYGAYKVTIHTEFGHGAKKTSYKEKYGIDISDEDDFLEYIEDDFLDNVDDYRDENEAFDDLLKDATKEGLDAFGSLSNLFGM